jgi:hypothetical protein
LSKSLSRNALLRSAIYDYILRSGAAGYTDQEIADFVGIAPHRIRARRHELVQSKHLMTLHPRRTIATGRKATVWLTTGVVRKLLVYRHQYSQMKLIA